MNEAREYGIPQVGGPHTHEQKQKKTMGLAHLDMFGHSMS
jgi:hypothetical protein